MPGFSGGNGSDHGAGGFQIGEDRFHLIEAQGKQITLVTQLLAQISGERGGLIVGQVERHVCEMVRLTVAGKAVWDATVVWV